MYLKSLRYRWESFNTSTTGAGGFGNASARNVSKESSSHDWKARGCGICRRPRFEKQIKKRGGRICTFFWFMGVRSQSVSVWTHGPQKDGVLSVHTEASLIPIPPPPLVRNICDASSASGEGDKHESPLPLADGSLYFRSFCLKIFFRGYLINPLPH